LVATGETADPAFPDGSPELILNLADPFIAIDAEGRERSQPLAFLVGQITGPFHVRPSGRVDLVGIRLEACGATWLAENVGSLTDDYIDVGRVHGGALGRLRDELIICTSPEDRAARLDRALEPLIFSGRAPDPRVRAAVREIRASGGLVDIRQLAVDLRTTPRTLQRHFATDVGITPKMLARIVRFQHVFSAWREDSTTLSRVAAECGYFDHAHLVRDFRELAGEAPASFLADQPEFTRFFTS
jgi:AraC-like DNA-binding protein